MSRRAKELESLRQAEDQLRAILVPCLRLVAAGKDTGFFVTQYNKRGMEVYDLASRVVKLSERLGQDSSALLATQVLAIFSAANNLADAHRLGPIRLAQKCLEELGGG